MRGVEAVIDKDLTAALLANRLAVDRLVIATDVDAVVLGWGTERAQPLGAVTPDRLREHDFADGSMGPKVEAACRFAESGGRAVITSLHRIADAVAGSAGTTVTNTKE